LATQTFLWAVGTTAVGVLSAIVNIKIINYFFEIERVENTDDWFQRVSTLTILKANLGIAAVVSVLTLFLRIAIPWSIIRWLILVVPVGYITISTGRTVGWALFAAHCLGFAKPVIASLIPHGIVEIPAVGGIFGYCLALALAPGSDIAMENFLVFGVFAAALVIAAIIETQISPKVGRWVHNRTGVG
jgi:uncharacterized membrane protein SpoIIM required for sporulation